MGGVFLFANEGSRRAAGEFDIAKLHMLDAGFELKQAELCENHESLDAAVKAAVAANAELVVVGGGDGTLGSVSEHFLRKNSAFGILPLGTGNQFAREIGVPNDLAGAVQVLKEGRTAMLDLGTANGQGFLTVATLGMTTEIARNLQSKQVLGKMSYLPALVKALQSMETFQVEIIGESETITQESIQVVVCNGRTHAGPFLASPDASITDGMFDIYALPKLDFTTMLTAGGMALTGQHVEFDEIDAMKSNRAVLKTDPKLPVVLDGEEYWFDEMVFELIPAAIKVVVDASFRAPQNLLGRLNLQLNTSEDSD